MTENKNKRTSNMCSFRYNRQEELIKVSQKYGFTDKSDFIKFLLDTVIDQDIQINDSDLLQHINRLSEKLKNKIILNEIEKNL